jgi:hypothetical protein
LLMIIFLLDEMDYLQTYELIRDRCHPG